MVFTDTVHLEEWLNIRKRRPKTVWKMRFSVLMQLKPVQAHPSE